MPSIKYNKLIRDLIPQIIEKSSKKAITRVVNDGAEYTAYLDKKLEEELIEYKISGDIEELADMQEVIFALVQAKGISLDEFQALRQKKRDERGGFEDQIVLVEVIE
ncbi:hypothetical protein ASZ90_019301 [hydrocarbon metagenome]|uniref:Phosphoribosyl-ATP pyrophosphohydrolase n=1 Tax=hydrocarbon metagenome TaxID=938273 RepID=A0A0W8E3K0_9ZZZZ